MAELASGAVTALLGVIRNEQRLLSGVKGDVQFIKEEMESMNSFLMHLARTAPPGGEHDEQVRTWMSQVRLLAQDCNNCIDLYLYRGNPDIHLARSGLRRYLWLVPWFVQKMFAQHHAAFQLRELKGRARDVGERRLRYGVEVPGKAAGQSSAAPSPPGDDDEDGGDDQVAAAATHHSNRREAVSELDEYVHSTLVEWMKNVDEGKTGAAAGSMPSIAVVTPDTGKYAARALAREALAAAEAQNFQCKAVLIDISAVHLSYRPLEVQDIHYYILLELERLESGQARDDGGLQQDDDWRAQRRRKRMILWKKWEVIDEIQINVGGMKVDDKIEKIKDEVRQRKGHQLQLDLEQTKNVQLENEALRVLLLRLWSAERVHISASWYDDIIVETAKKLKKHMEAAAEGEEAGTKQNVSPLSLCSPQYENILREAFQTSSNSKNQKAEEVDTNITMLSEDQMKEIINKVKLEILQEVFKGQGTSTSKPRQAQEQFAKATLSDDEAFKETKMMHEAKQETLQPLQESTSDTTQATDKAREQDQISDASIEETIRKIEKIRRMIKEQLKNKMMVDKIEKDHLKNKKILIILKIDQNYVFRWEEIRNALSMLNCVTGTVIVTDSKNIQQAKEYCNPPGEPLDCSLVGLYHNTVLKFTRQQMHGDNKYDPKIFREILDKCESYEFSMKIFAHALYSNPKRSNEDLHKLRDTLQVPAKSLGSTAKKMFRFSYNDLPKEYKSCLLYLAIFPQGHKIRRSTLIGRWVAEGLITTDDWRWSSSVDRAERCFDALLDRWFFYPADVGATGKVKSCIVSKTIHEFITKIAKKQRIVETRLSHHLARHFSVFNDIHLRGSDTIHDFFQKMHETSQLSQLKVLDLESCLCIQKYQHYLKDVCSTILLLKYLSLRGTYITQLPSEINNLLELEVLDIRQTKVPASQTRNVMLLKLKRLLAGHTDLSSMAIRASEFFSVWIPEKIEKMVNMEVLSNVKAPRSQDLKDITKLWQLRKLGVVINDKETHLSRLLETISDLHECLLSLSITLPTTRLEGSPSIEDLPEHMHSLLKYSPKLLQSLSITGTTKRVALLPLLAKDGNQLNKITLTCTKLSHMDLEVLAKLPNLCCVRLQHIACTDTKLVFKNLEFKKVKYFLIEGSNLTEITFETTAAPELEKIVLSFTGYLKSLSGVDNLPKLEELELTNNGRLLSFFDKSNRIAKVTLRGTLLRQSDLQILSNKPNMRCLELLDKSYVESKVAFKENEFPKLNLLIVDCSVITNISFTRGSAPMLKKISWTFTNIESFSGINDLPNLKELQFNGDHIPNGVEETIKKHKNKLDYEHNKPGNQDQANGDTPDVSRFPFSWIKNKVCL